MPTNIIPQIKLLLEVPFNLATGEMYTNIYGNIPNTSLYTEDTITVSTILGIMVDWV